MNTRNLVLAALGGAALVAVPATVAVAVTQSDDSRAGVGIHRDDAPGRGADSTRQAQRIGDDGSCIGTGTGLSGMGIGGMGMTDADHRGPGHGNRGNGASAMQGGGDPAALVEDGGTLSSADAAALVFMADEEKLAHDLYVEFADAWGLRVFDNISSAEQQHYDTVGALLDAYGVDDPTDGLAAGEFANPAIQDLYDTLLAQGLESSTQALQTGALVEETDINDLRNRATDNDAIAFAFANLESGSKNHLRAFVMNLERAGVDYKAQVLDSNEVSELAAR